MGRRWFVSLSLFLRDDPVVGVVSHVDEHGHDRFKLGVACASGFGFDVTAIDGEL